MSAAQDVFCPALDCGAVFRTMDGLHDHIDKRHDGRPLKELRREADEAYGGGS